MGKKSRRREKKGPKLLKNESERKLEVDTIKDKLTSLGLSEEMPGIDLFYARAAEFVKTGESWSGKFKVSGCKRILDIILTSNKNKECLAVLLHNEEV